MNKNTKEYKHKLKMNIFRISFRVTLKEEEVSEQRRKGNGNLNDLLIWCSSSSCALAGVSVLEAYLHIRTHTYIIIYLLPYIKTYMHTYIPIYLPTYIHIHTCIPTYLHTYLPT